MRPIQSKEGYIKVRGGKVWYKISGLGKTHTPLLILHGGPGFPHNYLENLGKLSGERPVIFYDQLGCGKSDHPADQRLWTVEQYVTEVQRVIAHLELKKFHLYSHSWGTMLAMDYLSTKPRGVTSLILASPVISVARWQKTWNDYRKALHLWAQKALADGEKHKKYTSKLYRKAFDYFYSLYEFRGKRKPRGYLESLKGFNERLYEKMWGENEFTADGNLKGYDRTDKLKQIHAPTLITCGKYDGASPKSCRYYQSLLFDCKLVVFAKSAHMPHIEEREKYFLVLSKFLQSNDL